MGKSVLLLLMVIAVLVGTIPRMFVLCRDGLQTTKLENDMRKTWLSVFGIYILIFAAAAWAAPIPDENTFLRLNEFDEYLQEQATPPLGVDPKDRETSRVFYHTVYVISEEPAIGWTGNEATCTAGQTASDFKNAILRRVNYFRAMAGVPADISFAVGYTSKAQEAALMMSVNNSLSHNPPTTWTCYSAAGAEAAGSSNLYLGVSGWNAITGYIKDMGTGNGAVGHRRWILYPQTQFMGTGDIPGSNFLTANALWVFDSNIGGARPATRDEFVAWPPHGYVPYQIVFPRWSLSYPGADFSNAVVTVTFGGSSVPVKIEPVAYGYGENTIVWILNNMNDSGVWKKPVVDQTYSVSIQNVTVNGIQKSFEYTVTVFDPGVGIAELSVTPDSRDVPNSAGTTTFSVSNTGFGTMPWTAQVVSGDTWLLISDGSIGSDAGTVTCAFDVNAGSSARTGTIRVTADGATGSPKDVTVTQSGAIDIGLTGPGWNLISLPQQPSDTAIEIFLGSISCKYASVWGFQNGTWLVYDPANPDFSDLSNMEAGWGYWLNMTEPATLSVTGATPSQSMNLITGWNLVGYNSSEAIAIADALSSITGNVVSVWAYMNDAWLVYDPANPDFSDLSAMTPGYGYWINTNGACTWTLP